MIIVDARKSDLADVRQGNVLAENTQRTTGFHRAQTKKKKMQTLQHTMLKTKYNTNRHSVD